jgi:hypothetical protein
MKKSLLVLALCAFTAAATAQVDATKLALAREAITAMHADKMFDSMAAQMKQMASQYAQVPAGASAEEQKKAAELQAKIMDLSMNEAKALVAKMDAIYAEVYSEGELKAMVAFFKSPEGQSMLAKQPQVMGHLMPLVQEMQGSLMPKIKQLVDEAKSAK